VGDYLAATGVLSIAYVDPDEWPNTGDEFYAYCILTGPRGPTDNRGEWDIIHAP
jgi:hypothetical protein